MGERLTQRKRHLVPVERSPKQDRQQLGRALRASANRNNLRTARPMMCREVADPRVQPEEREVVRRQDKRLGRNCAAQPVERTQKTRQRIAVGFVSLDADIGRDLGQDLITRDQYAGLGAIEAGELRGMAFTGDHSPFQTTDLDNRPLGEPLKARRHRRDAAAIALMMFGKKLA